LVVKERRDLFPISDADISFAKTHAIDSSLSLCEATIGGVVVKTLVETIRPSGFLRSLFV
jgi:hypothetical protein